MLTILYVSAMAERGGLEVVLLNVLKSLDRRRLEPLVVLLENGPFVGEVEATGTEVHVVRAGRVRNLVRGARAIAKIRDLIQHRRVRVVHAYNAKAHVYGGIAAVWARAPCIYHLHGVPRPTLSRDGLVSLLSVMIPAQRTIACSHYVADAFKAEWPLKRDISVIHNGLVPRAADVHNLDSTVRQELRIPLSAPLILIASRLQRWKGVHVFIEAAARVARTRPDARFIVAGGSLFGLERDYAAELRDQVERLGLGRVLLFVGYRPDVSRFFAAADIVVHSSVEPEPFGMVLLEAMVWGKPVVASDLGGPREIVKHEVTGLLVRSNSPEDLARAILRLLASPDQSRRMGQAGALRVQRYFTAEMMVGRLETLYEDLAAEPKVDD